MTRDVFVLVAGQAPVAGMEYVMVYEPALLADTSTKPEVLLMLSPGAEKDPPAVPESVTGNVPPVGLQAGEPA
jgi:hypothetical protein